MSPATAAPPDVTYIAGLDLGQANDYTAFVVLERSRPEDGSPNTYACRHLERFALGTSYPAICERVTDLFRQPPLAGGHLVVDNTGVGRPVVDMLRKARPQATIRPITITAGHAVVPEGAGWHVPKKELASVLMVLLQSRRLAIARTLPETDTLLRELATFRVKITTAGNETFEGWRTRDHDDLVLSVGIAAWVGERGLKRAWIR